MDDETRNQLRSRFGFSEWQPPSGEPLTRGTGDLAVVGAGLGGWRAQRVDAVQVPGARAASRSMWSSADRADALLSLELIETESAEPARELLLDLLNEFQSPRVERQPDAVAGEVAFTVPGETAALFARSNVVALVRNAGRDVVSVADFARQLDRALTRR